MGSDTGFWQSHPGLESDSGEGRIELGKSGLELNPGLEDAFGIEQDRDRPRVNERHMHCLLKAPGDDGHSQFSRFGDHALEEWPCDLRRRGLTERRSAARAGIGPERKLRDEPQRAAAVCEGKIHLALIVLEYPEANDLSGQVRGIPLGVPIPNADQHEQAGPHFCDALFPYVDARLRHALHHRTHAQISR